jgi:hypothetical protein
LYWDRNEADESRTVVCCEIESSKHSRVLEDVVLVSKVGSMLKTPKYPIWLVVMNNLITVLFNTNMGLMNDWRLEKCFTLYFYSGLHKQESIQKLTIGKFN